MALDLMNLYVRQFIMIINRLNNRQGICCILHNYNAIVGNLSIVNMFKVKTVLMISSCIMLLTDLTVGVHIVA